MNRRYTIEALRGRRTLLVASTGGHLTQLVKLEQQLRVAADSPWLTFDMPQSRSLLAGREVLYVPYVAPRDLRGVVSAALRARPAFADVRGAVSTGAGLALAALPELALRHRVPTLYIESVSRTQGPSLTGRLLRRLPRVGLYCQHDAWCVDPWRLGPSVLDDYRTRPRARRPIHRVLVTLGTIRPYRFDRLVDQTRRALRALAPQAQITWQLGSTTREDLPGMVVDQLDGEGFAAAVARADLVIAHAGVGVAMSILDHGKVPVLMPRDPARGEHVDGHQRQILDYLVSRGLAVDLDRRDFADALDVALRTEVASVPAAPSRAVVSLPAERRREVA